MEKINQIERILQILSFLAHGEKLSASMVEKRFEYRVSKRDIQRDFWHIVEAHMPINYEMRGREKIWFFNPSYQARLAPMFENRLAA